MPPCCLIWGFRSCGFFWCLWGLICIHWFSSVLPCNKCVSILSTSLQFLGGVFPVFYILPLVAWYKNILPSVAPSVWWFLSFDSQLPVILFRLRPCLPTLWFIYWRGHHLLVQYDLALLYLRLKIHYVLQWISGNVLLFAVAWWSLLEIWSMFYECLFFHSNNNSNFRTRLCWRIRCRLYWQCLDHWLKFFYRM